jgi:hypothetical protein
MRYVKIICFLFCSGVLADSSAYSKNVSIFARYENLILLHEHKFNYDVTNDRYNVVSYIELLDVASGKSVFRKNSAYFSNVFILENGAFFLGISNIKAGENPQLVVYFEAGEVLFEKSFRCADLPLPNNCVESSYNYINWFNEHWPHIESYISDGFFNMKVDGNPFSFSLNAK